MGFGANALIIVTIIILISVYYPDTYNDGREWVTDTTQNLIKNDGKFNFTESTEGRDYGKILGHLDCKYDIDCIDFFGINNMECTINNTCFIGAK